MSEKVSLKIKGGNVEVVRPGTLTPELREEVSRQFAATADLPLHLFLPAKQAQEHSLDLEEWFSARTMRSQQRFLADVLGLKPDEYTFERVNGDNHREKPSALRMLRPDGLSENIRAIFPKTEDSQNRPSKLYSTDGRDFQCAELLRQVFGANPPWSQLHSVGCLEPTDEGPTYVVVRFNNDALALYRAREAAP